MRRYHPLILCATLHFGVATLTADQVILKNGDRVTGEVLSKTGETLTLKSQHFGTISVKWEEVREIATDEPVTVVLSGGDSVKAPVATKDSQVIFDTPDRREQPVPLAEVVTLRGPSEQAAYERLLDANWGELWTGTISFGISGTQGNAETRTLTTGFGATRVTRTDKTTLYMNAINAAALVDGVEAATARAIRGGLAYSHNVGDRLFMNGFNDYEFDRFQNLDLRTVFGGGLGYTVWTGERGRFDLQGGGAWNRERFAAHTPDEAFTRHSAEAYFGDDLTYKLTSVTALTQSMRFFPNISNSGAYRANFDLAATTRLFKWLNWNISVSDRYLSNPIPGRRKNDFLYTTGIGIGFAR